MLTFIFKVGVIVLLLSIVIVIPLGIFSIVPIVALTNWSPLYTKTLQVVKLAKALEILPGKHVLHLLIQQYMHLKDFCSID